MPGNSMHDSRQARECLRVGVDAQRVFCKECSQAPYALSEPVRCGR